MNSTAPFDRRRMALIFLLATLVFLNTLAAPFQWDGIEFIADNPIIHDLDNFLHPSKAAEFRWYGAFKNRYTGYLSFALNYSLHGNSPPGYHVFNITVHAMNSLLVYFMAVLLFRSPALKDTPLAERSGAIAMWAALIFAAHPVQTEAVTYIFQRHASLVALFYLGGTVCYLMWRVGGRVWWYALALISAVVSMKTKENAFTLPLMILLIEYLFFSASKEAALKGKNLLWLVPILLTMLVVPLSLIGLDRPAGEVMAGLGQRAGSYASLEGGGREYLFTQVRVVATYLRLFIFPINQNLDYDYISGEAGTFSFVAAGFLHLLIWLSAGYLLFRGRRCGRGGLTLIGFGVVWFYLALAVESSVIAIPMVITEYRMYVPLVGLALGASVLVHEINSDRARQAVLVVLVGLLAVLAVERNSLWTSSVDLWADTASKSPQKARPWYNLGVFTEAGGNTGDAIAHYRRSVDLDPGYLDAHYNLGVALAKLERFDEAALSYNRVLELSPAHAGAVNNLGVVYERLGRLADAARAYERSLELRQDTPGSPGSMDSMDSMGSMKARLNLGSVLVRLGQYEQARVHIEGALSSGEGGVRAHEDLGLAYFHLGQFENAARSYRSAVALDPMKASSLFNLGTVSLRLGRLDQAENQFRNAIAINEKYSEAHMGLAAVFEGMGREAEAIKSFETAVAVAPNNSKAYFRLGTYLDMRGEKKKASESYLRAIELDPDNADALNNLGTIHNERGDTRKALRYFELAVTARPGHADAHNNLGVVYYDLRRHRDAYEEFRQAVVLAPGNRDFQSNLRQLELRLGIKDQGGS